MGIRIQADISRAMARLDDFSRRQVPYALANALTMAAQDVVSEETRTMRSVFDRPTPSTLNSVQFTGARKTNLTATVRLRGDAAKGSSASQYLAPQILGGDRRQKRGEMSLHNKHGISIGNVWVRPARGKEDQYGNIRKGEMGKLLSALQASFSNSVVRVRGREQMTFQLLKEHKKLKGVRTASNTTYFIGAPANGKLPFGVWIRSGSKGRKLTPVLIMIKQPHYKQRFPFYEVAEKVVQQRMARLFNLAMKDAMRTAR